MNLDPTNSPLKILSDDKYVRDRLKPNRFHGHYPHLADLAGLVGSIAPGVRGRVFDYGSGGAPYASLFAQASGYVAADLEPGPRMDRLLRPDGRTDEPDQSYDFVLSTQVLEHVPKPRDYLEECFRILRPGGCILLTTHGMFEEHGCPHDYHRWTARGLEDLFTGAGLQIFQSGKLTTEIRGVVQMLHLLAPHLRCPERPFLHLTLSVARKLYLRLLMPPLNCFADCFGHQAMADAQSPSSLYVAVFVYARKPGAL